MQNIYKYTVLKFTYIDDKSMQISTLQNTFAS